MDKKIFVPIIAITLAALVLLGGYNGFSDVRNRIAAEELTAKMQTILPGSDSFEIEEYTGDDANIQKVYKGETGYVILTQTNGYAGSISMLVGVTDEGKVTGLQVRRMEETLGLGGKILSDWEYLAQYLNTTGDAVVGENLDAISGATVTSKAVTRCVNSAVGYVTGADASSGATSWGG